MKKRFKTFLFAAIMTIGLGTAVMAEDANPTPTPTPTPTATPTPAALKKNYEATNNKQDKNTGAELYVSPAETFAFTINNTSVTDAAAGVDTTNMPTPTVDSITYAAGGAGSADKSKLLNVTLPTYTSVGVYTYTIKETAGNTAGVTYLGDDITLVVTVQQVGDALVPTVAYHIGSTKPDHFENTYEAGSLDVTKTVTGNLGDRQKEFTVTVTFTAPTGKQVKESITYLDGTTAGAILPTAWSQKTAADPYTASVNITLKHDETVTFDNVPYDVTYEVVEADYTGGTDKYDAPVYSGDGGSTGEGSMDKPSENVGITNNKDAVVDTGIFVNNLPYIIIAVIVVCGFAVLLFGRRRREDR